MDVSCSHVISAAIFFAFFPNIVTAQDCNIDMEFYKMKQESERKLGVDYGSMEQCLTGSGGVERFFKERKATRIMGDQMCDVKLPASCNKQQRQFCSTVKELTSIYDAESSANARVSLCNEKVAEARKKEERQRSVKEKSSCEGPNCTVK